MVEPVEDDSHRGHAAKVHLGEEARESDAVAVLTGGPQGARVATVSPRLRIQILTALAASNLAAQDAPALRSRDHQRVAAVKLHEERVIPWGEQGLPALPANQPLRTLSLAFTGDGTHLVVQMETEWRCIEVATGSLAVLPSLGAWTLWGSVSGPRVYACHQGGLAFVTVRKGDVETIVESTSTRVRGGMVMRSDASTRAWFVEPTGERAICSHPPQILEFASGAVTPIAGKAMPTWAVWGADQQHVAMVRYEGTKNPTEVAIEVLDRRGESLARFATPRLTYCELDVGGRFVWWLSPSLCRGEINTGTSTVAKGPDQVWFWQVDPVLGIGLDGSEFCLWNLTDLEPVRRVPIGETRPANADAIQARTGARMRASVGCVLCPGAVATQRRDRIAISTFTGLRIFRVES